MVELHKRREYYTSLFNMTKFFLFGSAARGEPFPMDIDVIMIPADAGYVKRLERYSLDNHGKLDLFFYGGDCLVAAYDEHRRILLTKHTHIAVGEDLTEITFDALLEMLENTEEERKKRKVLPGYDAEYPLEE